MKLSQISKWGRAVLAYCQANPTTGMSPAEADRLAGSPGSESAQDVLETMVRDGFLKRISRIESLSPGRRIRLVRYYVADGKPPAQPASARATSYFEGIQRVSSVFELGKVL